MYTKVICLPSGDQVGEAASASCTADHAVLFEASAALTITTAATRASAHAAAPDATRRNPSNRMVESSTPPASATRLRGRPVLALYRGVSKRRIRSRRRLWLSSAGLRG